MDLNRKLLICCRRSDCRETRKDLYLPGIDDGMYSISRHEKHETGTMPADTMLNGTVIAKKMTT